MGVLSNQYPKVYIRKCITVFYPRYHSPSINSFPNLSRASNCERLPAIAKTRDRDRGRSNVFYRKVISGQLTDAESRFHVSQAALERGDSTLDGRKAVTRGQVEFIEKLSHLEDLHLDHLRHLAVAPVVLDGPGGHAAPAVSILLTV